ncbi:MAG TPA: ABC transporter ATP-binding protein [Myxococcota bacterium]
MLQDPAAERVAIEARGLTRRFGAHLAVDRLDLRIPAQTTFGLLGPNGAGKTTFIRMVTGYLLPSAGDLTVEGLSPIVDPVAVRRRVGFVMETSRLYPELRVLGFLNFLGGVRGLSGARLRRAVDSALERFHLTAVTQRRIGNLSKGFQQRVSLAQAFLHDPPLIVVDEPTEGLDPVQQAEVQSMLASLHGERTVLLCTHDLHEARKLTSRAAVLNRGRLAAQGPTERVLGEGDALALFRDPQPEEA